MEWVKYSGNVQCLEYGNIDLSVWPAEDDEGWKYSVDMFDGDNFIIFNTTDTEERAKRFAIYEAHRVIRDLVNDLAEITGENYHLELN